MGFRFRRSVRLFPGVRLNFSASGISTTIGGRGGSVTFSKRGTYANVSLPGTGLSYRTRIDTPTQRQPAAAPAEYAPLEYQPEPSRAPKPDLPPGATPIESEDIGVLTSSGLDSLRRLINESAGLRAEIERDLAGAKRDLGNARRRLSFARLFVIRIFTTRRRQDLLAEIRRHEDRIDDLEAQLAGADLDVDVPLSADAETAYRGTLQLFREAAASAKVWDVTSRMAVNQRAERTVADHSIFRTPVSFDIGSMPTVRTKYDAMRFGNANGATIYVFPAFVMVRGGDERFALLEIADVSVKARLVSFTEEENVPYDAERIGTTWKKSNKDGSRDKRFQGNYEIPQVKYAYLDLTAPTGLRESYMVSNAKAGVAFALGYAEYQKALAAMAKKKPTETTSVPAAVEPQSPEPAEPPVEPPEIDRPINVAGDWVALIVGLVAAVFFGFQAWRETQARANSPTPAAAITSPAPQVPSQSATAAIPAPQRPMVYIQKNGVNIRSAPSATASIVTTETRGRQFTIFDTQGKWHQIGVETPVGWIFADLVGPSPPQ